MIVAHQQHEQHRTVAPHPLENERPALQIDDLQTFGPYRLKASLLTVAVERREGDTSGIDGFVDRVSDVSVDAMIRGRGAVTVRFWVDAHSLVATVSDPGDGFDSVVSVSPAPLPAGRRPPH